MYVTRRLKPDGPWPALAFPLIGGPVFFALLLTGGPKLALPAVGVMVAGIAAYNFIAYLHTRNPAMLVVICYLLLLTTTTFTVSVPLWQGRRPTPLAGIPLALMVPFGIWTFVLVLNKRGKWRGRELLELAAQPVDETAVEGYTSRPRPVGKVDLAGRQFEAFLAFLQSEMIAWPRREPNRTVFVLVLTGREPGYVLGMRHDLDRETWVAIDDEGNVSVHIAMRDYQLYREDLDFDELCASLGQVFIGFATLFAQGKTVRIIDQLNAMPVGIMS